jgi:hypothetical protein
MPDTYRKRAQALLHRAAQERNPGRARYLGGLARSYEELARQHGEPELTAMADRVVALQAQGLSQNRIGEMLGVTQQRVSQVLREATRD